MRLKFALGSDDQRGLRMTPLRLRNMKVQLAAEGDARGKYALTTTPGQTRHCVPVPGGYGRGAFAEDGTLGSKSFYVMGQSLVRVEADGTFTILGAIPGFGPCVMVSNQGKLYILGNGEIYEWDGASLTQVTDVNRPRPAATLCALAKRLISSTAGTGVNGWSATADGMTWPPLAFAESEVRPDPVLCNFVRKSDWLSFGSRTIQPYVAMGGTDDAAFQSPASTVIEKGTLAGDTVQMIDEVVLFVGNDSCVYRMDGFRLTDITGEGLTRRLERLTASQITRLRAFTYKDGKKPVYALLMPDGMPSMEYDLQVGRWRERTTGVSTRSTWSAGFSCEAYRRTFVISPESDVICYLDADAATDDGAIIERVFAVHVPLRKVTVIDNIDLNVSTWGQPLTGQGSEPVAKLRFSRDGGQLTSLDTQGFEREFLLGRAGRTQYRPQEWCFGEAGSPDGILLEWHVTDPVHFTVYDAGINEEPLRVAA